MTRYSVQTAAKIRDAIITTMVQKDDWITRSELIPKVCGSKLDKYGKDTAVEFLNTFQDMVISEEIQSVHTRGMGTERMFYRLNLQKDKKNVAL